MALLLVAGCWYSFADTGDDRLGTFVKSKPPVPIVFTSRSEPTSFRAAADVGDYTTEGIGARGVGQPQWQARDGRLRILATSGRVRELTWGQPLPDGGTLTDVMSPSVSPDGKSIVFAGRRTGMHGARFRLYVVGIDGSGLQALTGDADDTGCVRVPPLRFDSMGDRLADDKRRALDYDDIDPTTLPDRTLIFASSRQPDTGGCDRRSTQIWVREAGQAPRPLTASRANDRWPFVAVDRSILFSLWSRQDEVISTDGTGLVRHSPPRAETTAPTDRWLGATITPSAESFSQLLKPRQPVWRPRPLTSGKIVFMTVPPEAPAPFSSLNEHPEAGRLAVAQAPQGYVTSAPSSLGTGGELPEVAESELKWLHADDGDGSPMSLATPSALPTGQVVVSGAKVGSDGRTRPGDYGLYIAPQDDWSNTPDRGNVPLTALFDDPDLVDGEAVGVYARAVEPGPIRTPTAWPADQVKEVRLADGTTYVGPAGKMHIEQLGTPATGGFPGQNAKDGKGPIYPHFPEGSIRKLAFYASHRDRYDDPDSVIVRGTLQKLLEAPTDPTASQGGRFEATMPVGAPTLLIGLGADGKVVNSSVPGRNATFYAFAGDHVSGTRPGGYHFCSGCHTGHTFAGSAIAEPKR